MDKKKILIVDDDPDFRKTLNVRLRSSGYTTAFAEDSVTAIGIARRELPDLILLDLGLPGGDGFLLMERLQNLPALSVVPVIVLSARDRIDAEKKTLQSGAEAYFQKPPDTSDLLQAIERALQVNAS